MFRKKLRIFVFSLAKTYLGAGSTVIGALDYDYGDGHKFGPISENFRPKRTKIDSLFAS